MRVKPATRNRGARQPKPDIELAYMNTKPSTSDLPGASPHFTTSKPVDSDSSSSISSSTSSSTSKLFSSYRTSPASTSALFDTVDDAWDEEVAAFLGGWPATCDSCFDSPCASPDGALEYTPPSVEDLDTLLRSLSIQPKGDYAYAPLATQSAFSVPATQSALSVSTTQSAFPVSADPKITLAPCFVPATHSVFPPTAVRKSAFPPCKTKLLPALPAPAVPASPASVPSPPALSDTTPAASAEATLAVSQSGILMIGAMPVTPRFDRTDSDVTLVNGEGSWDSAKEGTGKTDKDGSGSSFTEAPGDVAILAKAFAALNMYGVHTDSNMEAMDAEETEAVDSMRRNPVTQSTVLGAFAATLAVQMAVCHLANAVAE